MLTAGDLRTTMIPTPVKTSAYTAHHGDFVLVDTTTASVTVTLPLNPPQNSVVGAKQVATASGHTVTVRAAGADAFNLQGGATTLTLTLLSQGVLLQYASGVWVVQSDDLPLAQLDGRYAPQSQAPPWVAPDAGYLAWSYDPVDMSSSTVPGAGSIILSRVNIRAAITCTNVVLALGTAGSGLTANENFAGLFSSAGTLIAATADQSTAWTTAGITVMALTGGPYALAAGFCWVGFVANGTPPGIGCRTSPTAALANPGLTPATARFAFSGSGKTSLASFTPSASTFYANQFWSALS